MRLHYGAKGDERYTIGSALELLLLADKHIVTKLNARLLHFVMPGCTAHVQHKL